jgi:dihydroorotate dehydrogenase
MLSLYKKLRPLLYSFEPEDIHEKILSLGKLGKKIPGFYNLIHSIIAVEDPRLRVKIGNLNFPNPLGLAAGFDKDGIAVPLLQALGFGHLEVGTVTPLPQPGNPGKRLFRLEDDQALINRMGFNNSGVIALVQTLSTLQRKVPVGVNLGKNRDTPLAQAAQDYIRGLKATWSVADYFTINVSSPNTLNLRDLQDKKLLYPLVQKIVKARDQMQCRVQSPKQIWLKIAPDLTDSELKVIVEIAKDLGIDALIVANTTISRSGLKSVDCQESGGLSGKPMYDLSNQVLEEVYKLTQGELPLIGVGGIFSAKNVIHKMRLGAVMVQLLTGLVYRGPGIVRRINGDLLNFMEQEKIQTVTALTGENYPDLSSTYKLN